MLEDAITDWPEDATSVEEDEANGAEHSEKAILGVNESQYEEVGDENACEHAQDVEMVAITERQKTVCAVDSVRDIESL